jgi:HrpA-like RNA helicase
VQVRRAVELLITEGQLGHVLIFLPGAAEIRRAMRECAGAAKGADLLMLPLHGDLSPGEQDRAVSPSSQRKVIFATNVAESSVTVDGVSAVIDSGLAAGPKTVTQVKFRSASTSTDEKGRAIRIDNLKVGMRVPVGMSQGPNSTQYQYLDTGINTDIEDRVRSDA